ncbi:MAG: InlB B-repeat-containing protein, partial [Kiritimatiellae bacterium]|nr:InlB B-repeat-containing protein [Kiritimatiellia bacterium]
KGALDKLASSEIGWVTAADYDESSYDGDSYEAGATGAVFLCGFTEGWWNGQADSTGVGDGDGYMDGYEGWKYGYDYCSGDQTPQYYNTNALRRVELGRSGERPPSPTLEQVRIVFNANGGTCRTTSRTITEGTAIGTLPTAARAGFRLIGWYTARTGGTRITASTTFSAATTVYARWAKATYTVAFNANGGQGRMAAQRMTYGTASRLRANAFLRSGYVFIGWARTRTGAVAYTNRQAVRNLRTDGRTTTLYAKWARRTYKVAFNANGGTGRMAQQAFIYGRAGRLRANAFTRRGYTFGGWATSRTGDIRYVNRQAVKNLRTDGRTTTLYAFWQLPLPTALDTSLSFTTGGNAGWFGQTTENHDGVDAARSGKISHSQNSWMQTTVSGTGTLSFWWKVSCEEDYDYLQFLVDGVEQRYITGTDGTWTRVSLAIREGGSHVLKWNYHKEGSVSDGSDRAWVDQVSWTATQFRDLETALDNTSLYFTTDGSEPWYGQTSVSHDGVDAAHSGGIADSQNSSMQTTVTGPGTVSFWWKVSSEENWDKLEFVVDGEQKAVISGTNGGWSQVSSAVSGSGSHVLAWTYFKDGSVSRGDDCGWVDQVRWSGSSTPAPTSSNKYALCVGINEYSLSGCSTLSGCVNDALYFSANLKNRGGWPAGNMTKLTDSGATKTAIRNAITGYASRAAAGD